MNFAHLLKLIYISLACAFISNVITRQNGPMMVFSALRMLIGKWTGRISHSTSTLITTGSLPESKLKWVLRKNKSAKSVAELFSCPFCLGPWLCLLGVAIFANESLICNWLVSCGLLYIWLGMINK